MAITSQTDTNIVPNSSAIIQFNPTSQLPIKLTGSTNFTTWKAQLEMLLIGHDLFGHLDGTTTAPSATITQNTTTSPNPAYKNWLRQDKLIQTAILASVDSTLAPMVATASNSKLARDSLHTTFANKSHTRIFSLRDHLSRIMKGQKTIAEYLREIRSLADELSMAGSPVSQAELTVKILAGLPMEYHTLAAAIRARETPISYEDLFDRLTDQELVIKHDEQFKETPHITAAVAISRDQPHQQHPFPSGFNQPRPFRRPQGQWRNSGNPSQNMQPWRNNYSYGDSGRSNNRLRCQLCDKSGHTAKVCRSRSHNHVEAKAHFVNGFQQHTAPWIVDSGASHHITSDANNFTEIQNYSGPDTIAMGDGNAIPISQTGKAKISSSHYQFNFQNTLCAPNIKRNLISVSQFCKDNLTSVEFFPSKFLVKDLASGAPLVCGQSKEGLYEWPLPVKSQPPQAHLVSQQKSLQL